MHDENVIATIHYYSEWCFSGNLGTTGSDDPVNGGETTSRDAIVATFKTVYDKFIANGIGIVVGEYGLLGTNEVGEYVKYIESVNAVGHKYGIQMDGWPATMTFGTTPTDFTMGGIIVYYYDIAKYVNAQFAIKAKPEVQGIALHAGETSKVQVQRHIMMDSLYGPNKIDGLMKYRIA